MMEGHVLELTQSNMNLAKDRVLVVAIICCIDISSHATRRVESLIRARHGIAPMMLWKKFTPCSGSNVLSSSGGGVCVFIPCSI